MMATDDDQSEAVDWGDGDEGPEETAESVTAGIEADAVSLASDDDDLEALKKYHQHAWDDSHEPPASDQASQDMVHSAAAPAPITQEQHAVKDGNINQSTRESATNVHGLPPKPASTVVYSKGTPSSLVSTSATSMAQRDARVDGIRNSPEPRDANRPILPHGWEIRTSRAGKVYYYNDAAGKTQWDIPTEPIYPARSTSSREHSKKVDRAGPRRSRSRERRPTRRSLSPPRAYRPRSRSLDREAHYRTARNVSLKREIPRASREVNAARVRSRPPSRERGASPKPSHAAERRSRSPPRVRESRDGPRQESRLESSHQSRHRSPIPRARSQERDSYRPSHGTKPSMDIDHREQTVHGTVRRRRSWNSPDPSDTKRRRVASPPPPPPASKGVDRYVPDRSSRMELDPPTSRQDTKRPDGHERPRENHHSLPQPPPRERRDDRHRENQSSLPQPPPRERRDHPAGDREQYRLSTSQGQRTSPRETLKAIEPSPAISRSRAPLPPQSEAMRSGNNPRKQRHVPMDVDVDISDSLRPSHPEQVSMGAKGGRPRGRGRSKSPARPHDNNVGRSKPEFPAPSGSYDQPPKVDRTFHREVATPVNSRNGIPSRPHFPSDGFNGSQQGRGSRAGPLSTSNLIPLANPKEFGRSPGTGNKDEAIVPPPEQASTSNPNATNETKQNSDAAQKRSRASRFGPPVSDAKPEDATLVPDSGNIYRLDAETDKQDAIPPSNDTSTANTDHSSQPTSEGLQGDLPPHAPNSEQDARRSQYVRREDGLRINRNRTSKVETDRSGHASELAVDAAPPAKEEERPMQEPGEYEDVGGSVQAATVIGARVGDSSRSEVSELRSPAMSPATEGSKPAAGRQSSLLDRLAPAAQAAMDNDEQGVSMDGDEGGATGTDRTRKPRGRRSHRGGRR